MIFICVMSAVFLFGYIVMRRKLHANMFLVVGAGVAWMGYFAGPPDGLPEDPLAYTTAALVSVASILGYFAWHGTKRWLDEAPFGKERVIIFVGFAVNWGLSIILLRAAGIITL